MEAGASPADGSLALPIRHVPAATVQHAQDIGVGLTGLLIDVAPPEDIGLGIEMRKSALVGIVLGVRKALTCHLHLDRLETLPERDIDFTANGCRECCRQAVIIVRGDRVVLVIVAAGTADGQAEESGADRGDNVIELVVAGRFKFGLGQLGRECASPKKPVAARASGSAGASSSPAICQAANCVKGMSRLSAPIKKSR